MGKVKRKKDQESIGGKFSYYLIVIRLVLVIIEVIFTAESLRRRRNDECRLKIDD